MGSCNFLRRMIFGCLYLLMLLAVSVSVLGQPNSNGFINIDCGLASNTSYVHSVTGLRYVSDDQYIDTGVNEKVSSQYSGRSNYSEVDTLRSFPNSTKNCYTLTPVSKGLKYLVRAIFYYGNYDGLGRFRNFDLYFGVNFWDTITIYEPDVWYPYEIIAVAPANYIQVCLVNTGHGTPFISLLELRPLSSTIYQHANSAQSLNLRERMDVGSDNTVTRYPSDAYDRLWFNYTRPSWMEISTMSPIQDSTFAVPSSVLQTAAFSTAANKSIDLTWSTSNKSTTFLVVLHFAEIQFLQNKTLREFYVYVNGVQQYTDPVHLSSLTASYFNCTITGYEYYALSLQSTPKATLPPMLNAFEMYTILPVILLPTYDQDVAAVNSIKASYSVNKGWNGDPCVPTGLSWTGVNCTTNSSSNPRITTLDLSSSGLTGEMISAFGNLTALQTLDLSHNSLTGLIPSSLDQLVSLTFLDLSENSGLLDTLPPGLMKKQNNGLLTVKFNDTVSVPDTKKSSKAVMLVIVAVVITLLIVGTVLFFLCLKKQKNGTDSLPDAEKHLNAGNENSSHVSPDFENNSESGATKIALIYRLCDFFFFNRRKGSSLHFSYRLRDLKKATKEFSDLNKIGNGGFGVVYKGLIDGQIVAIKRLNRSLVNSLGDVAKEVCLLSSLKNDNLVKLLGFCVQDGHYILVYEYISNGDLSMCLTDETKRPNLNWKRRFKIIEGIAKGLSYLHHNSEKILHLDLKPENILLDEDYNAKVADFGLSRILNKNKTHITTKNIAGTLGYIAPELFSKRHYSSKSDVYCCGLLILEILAGSTIGQYAKNNDKCLSHVVWRQWKNNLPLLEIIDSSLRDRCPQDQIVRCILIGLLCIQNDPEKRPTMEDMLKMLNSNDSLPEPSIPAFLPNNDINPQTDNDEHHINASNENSFDENGPINGAGGRRLTFQIRPFSSVELKYITNDFGDKIGSGGFGEIFKGFLPDRKEVAVKVLSKSSSQGFKQFSNEVESLSRIHHKNLVTLIGYCDDSSHIALVYEYMEEGNLEDRLRPKDNIARSLAWKQRLRIAYESAQGLEYLHKMCNPPLIHRDVKSSNILLSKELKAKISDFGLVRTLKGTHVTTHLSGTPVYWDPYYASTEHLNEKSDVYSFGIILLEIVTGKSPVLPGGRRLTQFVQETLSEGKMESILDTKMDGQYNLESIQKVADMALRCIDNQPANRPDMTRVVVELKESLELEMDSLCFQTCPSA